MWHGSNLENKFGFGYPNSFSLGQTSCRAQNWRFESDLTNINQDLTTSKSVIIRYEPKAIARSR